MPDIFPPDVPTTMEDTSRSKIYNFPMLGYSATQIKVFKIQKEFFIETLYSFKCFRSPQEATTAEVLDWEK